MYSGHAAELGTGLGDASGHAGEDVDGLFGSILDVAKSIAAPAAGFIGGAVGTIVAPGLGTAAGAYLGGKLGGAISSSGGGGGGGGAAPAPSAPAYHMTGVNFASGGPMRGSSGRRIGGATAAFPKNTARTSGGKKAMLVSGPASQGMSTGTKIALGTGGVGAAALLTFLAYRFVMP